MSDKRFYVKKVTRDERPKLFSSVGADYKYFIVERVKRSWGEYGGNFLFNFGVDYAFAEKVCNLLNEQDKEIGLLRLELDTHKHPLWSTREAERKVNELADSLADEVKKNGLLNEEINQLRIENMRLKKKCGDE